MVAFNSYVKLPEGIFQMRWNQIYHSNHSNLLATLRDSSSNHCGMRLPFQFSGQRWHPGDSGDHPGRFKHGSGKSSNWSFSVGKITYWKTVHFPAMFDDIGGYTRFQSIQVIAIWRARVNLCHLPSAEPLSHVRYAVWKFALPHLVRGLGHFGWLDHSEPRSYWEPRRPRTCSKCTKHWSTSGVATFQLSNCHPQVELPCALPCNDFKQSIRHTWTAGKSCWISTTKSRHRSWPKPMFSMDSAHTAHMYWTLHHYTAHANGFSQGTCLAACCRVYSWSEHKFQVQNSLILQQSYVRCHTVPLWCFRWPGWYDDDMFFGQREVMEVAQLPTLKPWNLMFVAQIRV